MAILLNLEVVLVSWFMHNEKPNLYLRMELLKIYLIGAVLAID